MSQKFKSDIELQAGLRDSSGSNGTSGQILSSNGSTVSWIAQGSSIASDVQNLVKAGVAINKGQAVYVTGADGTNIIVGKASNTSEATSSKTLGLLNATVAINGMADVVQIGRLAGLNTIGAIVGDPVWLGTNGNLIYGLINKPYAPAHLVFLGIVTRVNSNNGEIFVNVQNGFELNEIHDVDLKTNVPVNGDILGYNGTLWVNKTIAGWLGYTPQNAATAITTSNIGSQSVNYANTAGSAGSVDFNNLTNKTGGTGTYQTSGDFRAPIFYDSDNTGYYVDPNGSSNLNVVTGNEFYNYGWFRNYNSNTGLYNQANGNHIYSIGGARWGITGNGAGSTIYLDFYGNYQTTYRGSIHADTNSSIGFLTNDQGWGLRVETNKNVHIHGTTLYISADGQNSSNIIMRDGDEGDRQIHCNSNRIGFLTAGGSWGSWCEDNGAWSTQTAMYSPIYYDYDNTAYYVDPSATSNLVGLTVTNTITGNISGTAGSLLSYQSNWASTPAKDNVVGLLGWKNYGNSHVIFDASASTTPSGTACNNANAQVVWSSTYPTLMGWNGANTYGVRVDSARIADSATSAGSVDFNNLTNKTGGTGTYQTSGDFRAPVFYDSNNTAYFLDPNSNSNITTLALNGNDNQLMINAPINGAAGIFYNENGNLKWETYHFQGAFRFYNYTTAQEELSLNNSGGFLSARTSMRAPIFYDSDNTGYYLDPAGSSQLSTVSLSAGAKLHLVSLSDPNHYLRYQNAGFSGVTIDGPQLSGHQGGELATNLGGDNWSLRWDYSGNTFSRTSSRSPIFYDSDNTAYYVDPSATSNLVGLTVANTITGNITGSASFADDANFANVAATANIAEQARRIDNPNRTNFTVGGNASTFYPVAIYTGASATDKQYAEFMIERGGYEDPGFTGVGFSTFNARFSFKPTGWGYGASYFNLEQLTSTTTCLGNYIDQYESSQAIIWLRGGTTYWIYSIVGNITMVYANSAGGDYVMSYGTYTPITSPVAKAQYAKYQDSTMLVQGSLLSGTDMKAPVFYDSNNTGYYLDPASTSVLSAIDTGNVGAYNRFRTWTELTGSHGFYSSINQAHIYPNNSSYGSWKIEGSRNGWAGIEMQYGSNGNVSFMTNSTSGESGMHNNSNGWQMRWTSGGLFSGTGAYGGGEQRVLNENQWINSKYFDSGGRIYGTVFMDANDSAFYFDGSDTGDSIRVAGDIVAYYSDERLKDKKGNIENALDKVLSLNGFYYEPNEKAQAFGYKKKLEVGLSAQEVEAVLPEIIKDAPIGHGYKTLDYGKLTPLLIEAIKEQQQQINDLKELVNKLINK
jgi:hypothetical protein